jgi:hypothetical protein
LHCFFLRPSEKSADQGRYFSFYRPRDLRELTFPSIPPRPAIRRLCDDDMLHFVGFKDDRWWNAIRVFGRPDFVHPGWDIRAKREIMPGDVIVFAAGDWQQEASRKSFTDWRE